MRFTKNFTVEMSNGKEVYYPACVTNRADHTADKRESRPMTKAEATAMVNRVTLFSTGVTARVVAL